jgi:hypothetical protein
MPQQKRTGTDKTKKYVVKRGGTHTRVRLPDKTVDLYTPVGLTDDERDQINAMGIDLEESTDQQEEKGE